MKKIILFLILFLIFFNQSFAATEEDTCISELSKAIKNDGRFSDPNIFKNNKGLNNILYNEVNNSYINISNYNSFTGYLVTNPSSSDQKHQNLINNNGFTNKDFIARRTNIATVVASSSFVISNIVGFGKDSNFTFPLSAVSGNSYGDIYQLNGSYFKEYVVYTHHSYKGDFLSCGIVHVKPLGNKLINGNNVPRGYGDIDETGYNSNVLTGNNCSSGFNGSNISKNGFNFYKMKTNVCVINYQKKDYLKMEVLSLAYKNGASYFSDYVAYNLQVQAMKDLTNQSKGLYGIRQIFLRYLDKGTCLKLLHTSTASLPTFCGGNYSDNFNLSGINISDINTLAFNKVKNDYKKYITSVFNIFLPQAEAARVLKNMDKLTEKARGMMALDNIPYNLYTKLQAITDDSFRDYLTLAISPNLEDLIIKRREQNIVVSPYEDKFLKCDIKYPERSTLVINFLKKLKDPKNIDFSNLTYDNPKFGDCIVPYPDKTHLYKEIEGSFDSNKLLAKKLNGTYKSPELSENILILVKKENLLNSEYENKLNILTKKFNENQISGEEFKKASIDEKKIYEENLSNIYSKKEKKQLKNNNEKEIVNSELKNIDKNINRFNQKTLIIIISLFIVGILVLFLSIRRKK